MINIKNYFLKYFLIILFLTFSLTTVKGESVKEALGENNYLLAAGTEKGDAYTNSYQRTYNPSIERWGTKVGVMPNGDAIIQLDTWTVADILGSNYHVLAYTPERGNCYVNANNETYTPGSNQYGRLTGRTAEGLPIITVVGTIRPETRTIITRTTTYYSGAPTPANQRQQLQSDDYMVWIYPEHGERYHSRQGCKPGSDKQVPYSSIIGTRFDTPCPDCWR